MFEIEGVELDGIVRMCVWRYGYDRPPEDREDFSQQCYLRLIEQQEDFKGLTDVSKIRQIAYTKCRMAILEILRKEKPEFSLSDRDVEAELNKSPDFLDIDDKLDIDLLLQKLDELPNPYKDVVKRRFGIHRGEETQKEIAARYEVSERAIRDWEKKGLEMLKEKMK